jgi:branched-chain amino acid transport system ATP-binding protein
MSGPVIAGRNLTAQFGSFRANDRVTIAVEPGERRAVIGPNGAGKTTLFNLLGGQMRPSSGTVELLGHDVTRARAYRRARLGLARTFQITNLLNELTTRQNVQLTLAAESATSRIFWRTMDSLHGLYRRAEDVLGQWGLEDVADTPVRQLGYGQQRVLEIVLAMCRKPAVLLLDEPTAGLARTDAERLTSLVAALPRSIAVVLIEHDMAIAFALADRVTVLHEGRVLAEGTLEEISSDRRVLEAYLGQVLEGGHAGGA